MAPLLSVRDLVIHYRSPRGPVQAVRGVSFDIEPGEVTAVIGESGSGKTTLALGLIRLIPRSATVARGSIVFERKDGSADVLQMEPDELRAFRWRDAAMVFQSALNSFNPVIDIWSQFLDTGRAHGMSDPRAVRARAGELLELVHLEPERVLRAYPHELSGGMKQRVLIALSLLLGPRLLILDEPTTALDILTQRAIIDLLRDLRMKLGFAMVFISHDLSLAAELADRVLTMYAGRVVEEARVDDLFYRPRHPYSVGLLKAVPRVTGELGALESIAGSPPDLVRPPSGCAYHPRCPFAIDRCRVEDPALFPVDTPDHAAACIRWQTVAETVGTRRPAEAL
ncbi:MAG TPA: ABC transporter ATP-binding protein [Candidatus Limnocylindria bacterium]